MENIFKYRRTSLSDERTWLLRYCSKLSIVNLSDISADMYSWIQVNASKLNLYIDFMLINGKLEDVFIKTNSNWSYF